MKIDNQIIPQKIQELLEFAENYPQVIQFTTAVSRNWRRET